jgi:hypothetical protein
VDDIGTFWVVTKPTGVSILIDILFETTIKEIMIQCRGGLETGDIIMMTKDENKAKEVAKKLLEQRGNTNEF